MTDRWNVRSISKYLGDALGCQAVLLTFSSMFDFGKHHPCRVSPIGRGNWLRNGVWYAELKSVVHAGGVPCALKIKASFLGKNRLYGVSLHPQHLDSTNWSPNGLRWLKGSLLPVWPQFMPITIFCSFI